MASILKTPCTTPKEMDRNSRDWGKESEKIWQGFQQQLISIKAMSRKKKGIEGGNCASPNRGMAILSSMLKKEKGGVRIAGRRNAAVFLQACGVKKPDIQIRENPKPEGIGGEVGLKSNPSRRTKGLSDAGKKDWPICGAHMPSESQLILSGLETKVFVKGEEKRGEYHLALNRRGSTQAAEPLGRVTSRKDFHWGGLIRTKKLPKVGLKGGARLYGGNWGLH